MRARSCNPLRESGFPGFAGRPLAGFLHESAPVANDGDNWVRGVRFMIRKMKVFMFLILFLVLLVVWLLGWVVFHVAGGLIHLLLIVAVIALIVHFARRRRA